MPAKAGIVVFRPGRARQTGSVDRGRGESFVRLRRTIARPVRIGPDPQP